MPKTTSPMILTLILGAALATQPVAATPQELREVNITEGSTSGWLPSEELEESAIDTFERYFSFIDAGEYDRAYRMLSEQAQATFPKAEFLQSKQEARLYSGALLGRERVLVTWTKDSPSAPQAGTYVAIDFETRAENIERQCGYLILFQPLDGNDFEIARVHDISLSNEAAASIASNSSDVQMELVWRELARSCPNYFPRQLPKGVSDGIGFETVAAARESLGKRSEVKFAKEGEWDIAVDEGAYTIWSFAPEGYPAYPAVIKRQVVPKRAGSQISMSMKCEADKVQCDNLFEEMARINGFIPMPAVEVNYSETM